MADLPPVNEPHVALNRLKREHPEAFSPDLETAMRHWVSSYSLTNEDAQYALNLLQTNPTTAPAIGIKFLMAGAPQPPTAQPPVAATPQHQPFYQPNSGGKYAYVPHNPNATIETDDLVAFAYGKRTLHKPAGLLIYFDYREQKHYDYWTTTRCLIQGQKRPIQPISRSKEPYGSPVNPTSRPPVPPLT